MTKAQQRHLDELARGPIMWRLGFYREATSARILGLNVAVMRRLERLGKVRRSLIESSAAVGQVTFAIRWELAPTESLPAEDADPEARHDDGCRCTIGCCEECSDRWPLA